MPPLERDPFSAPTAKSAKTAVAVAPAAPALPINPYRFAGELRTSGGTQRFLARGDDVFEAKAGDALDDGYVVESVSASAIVLVQRASGARQTLAVGAPAWEDPAHGRVQVAQVGTAQVPQAPLAELGRRSRRDDGKSSRGFFLDVGSPEQPRARTPR